MDTNDTTADGCCRLGRGLHYKSAEWQRLCEAGRWDAEWPEIDRTGRLTGQIVGNEGGYLNVDDAAMIPVAEAVAGGWPYDRDEGRAWPPMHVRVNQPQID